jgi:transposase InsO family protein
VFESSDQRVASLGAWLHGYNHHRRHTALAGYPPVSRVTNVPSFDT